MYIPMIDYLSFSANLENYPECAMQYFEELNRQKEAAKRVALDKSGEKAIITIGNKTFEVLPNGAQGYAFILHNSEYEIKIAQYKSKNDDYYPIMVRVYSECLWSKGPEKAYSDIYTWITENFGIIIDNKVSRMDLCCHTDCIKPNYEMIGNFKGKFRQKNIREYNRSVSGLEFGSRQGKVYCRIYNKSLEVKNSKKKTWFYEIWNDRGQNNDDVWNVEFELKREFFKEYQIESVEDAFARLNSMWEHCTVTWLVLTNNDASRIENCSINETWVHISNVFSDYVSDPIIQREKQLNADVNAMMPAAVGTITSLAARLGENDIHEVLFEFQVKGEQYLKNKAQTFENVINEKVSLLEYPNFNPMPHDLFAVKDKPKWWRDNK